jgi:hypothetical protein
MFAVSGNQLAADLAQGTTFAEKQVATSPDPEQAARIANAVGSQLSDVVGNLMPDRPDGSQSIKATTFAYARLPQEASSPKVLQRDYRPGPGAPARDRDRHVAARPRHQGEERG